MAKREPAAIRYKNPGAMWPGPIATRWGSTKWVYLNDGTGQGGGGKGNKIAIFDSWVDGIAAQLDLWRTKPAYKNQPFGEAIAIWAGHNDVPAYIRHVKARIPGMDENTIMNDAFWRGPNGVKFLKVQAAHEAGKAMPAPDADWLEAQRLVMSGARRPKPPKDPELEQVQERLKARHYSPGRIDGRWGGGTRGALSAFMLDRGMRSRVPASLEQFHQGLAGITAELDEAEAEGWFRPVTEERETLDQATVDAVAPEAVPIKRNYLATWWGSLTASVAALGTALQGYIASFWSWYTDNSDSGIISTAMEYAAKVPPWGWLLAIAVGLGYIAYNSRAGLVTIEQSVKSGERQ